MYMDTHENLIWYFMYKMISMGNPLSKKWNDCADSERGTNAWWWMDLQNGEILADAGRKREREKDICIYVTYDVFICVYITHFE